MRTFVYIVATMAACGASPLAALAQPAGEVQQRFDNQQQRINNGVATGALTRGEAARDESHLRADEALRHRQRVRDDGRPLTAGQKARDNHLLNHNSARIYDTKHNGAVGVPR
jgi:hypothetical protein